MKQVIIDGRFISQEHPPYIVAELSANHNGNLKNALDTIEKARELGADAIKIQTYTADTMTLDCDKDDFLIKSGLWKGYKLYDLYKEAETPYEWHEAIFSHCRKLGITCFSTPFDESAVDLLESLDVPAYKIASFELTDLPLIRYVAKTGKPMIISTGMATPKEIEEAVSTAREGGCEDIILLHCVSSYPASYGDSNLAMIKKLADSHDVVSGLSDHSLGTVVSTAASVLGASFIEKHFILDRKIGGPDSSFSIEPSELKELVINTRSAWESLGTALYTRSEEESSNSIFRRSLYFVKDIGSGDVIDQSCIRRVRPGFGLEPKYLDQVLGKRLIKEVSVGTPVTWDCIDE